MTIKLDNIKHIYNEGSVFEKVSLNNISLEITTGEMVAIIGHTGSGKSTLIQHMNGLIKPTSGEVLVDEKNIHSDKSHLRQVRQKIGLVFQYPEHQLFEETIYKDVAYGPTLQKLSKEEITIRTQSALTVVGLGEEVYEKSPFELSGGQKRRAAIAGVLAMQPDVLILDEPVAGLDPRGRDEILSQIIHMHKELKITVILVSHSMDDVARLSQRVFVMNQGELACVGTPPEVFSQGDLLESIGLDVPQISKLMGKLGLPKSIFSVEEAVKVILDRGVSSHSLYTRETKEV